jgi:hypothetical protein
MLATAQRPAPPAKIKGEATIGWFQQALHKGTKEVFTEVKTITPQMAEVMLTNNVDNRGIKPAKLEQITADMRNGRWSFNGEPIIFADTGELNDGQHRLTAVKQSGVPTQMLIVFGVKRETRTTVDQGVNRNPGDYLNMLGVANAYQVASIARQLIAYEKAERKSAGRPNLVTAAEVMERIEHDNMALGTAARYGNTSVSKVKGMSNGTMIGIAYYLFVGKNANDGLAFMHQLVTGEELKLHDPAMTARNRLMQLDRKSRAVQLEIMIRAWNAYRERRELKVLPIRGQLPEVQ